MKNKYDAMRRKQNCIKHKPIIDFVCQKHGISREMIFSKLRYREVVNARAEILYRIYQSEDCTLEHIGTIFKMDHTSVAHSLGLTKAGAIMAKKYKRGQWGNYEPMPVNENA